MKTEFYGIEKVSLVDFDGKVSATLFTGKCNFRCPFCHNASLVLNYDSFQTLNKDEYLEYLKKRQGILDAVVITGGEPTLLPTLIERIKEIKQLGYLIKLDTNGTNLEVIQTLVNEKLIDYVAMDVKNSLDCYLETSGISNYNLVKKVEETINYLKENHIDYEFRTTLVKEFHNEESIHNLGILLQGAKTLYLQKFVDKGTCIKNNLHEVNEKKALEYKCLLEKYITNVKLRGY